MKTYLRERIVAAGMMAAATMMLSACAPTVGMVKGIPVASESGVAEYKAENSKVRITAEKPSGTLPAPGSKESRVLVTDVGTEYRPMVPVIEEAVRDFNSFAEANVGDLYAMVSETVVHVIDTPDQYTGCRLKTGTAAGWVCKDERIIVIYLPDLEEVTSSAGDVGVYMVVGHEFSHMLLTEINPAAETNDDAEELKAHCGAGSFIVTATGVHGWNTSEVGKSLIHAVQYTEGREAIRYGLENKYAACATYEAGMR